MFGTKEASWSLYSEKDPRFNMHGRIEICSIFAMPKEVGEAIKKKEEELKCKQPDDLEYLVMKI